MNKKLKFILIIVGIILLIIATNVTMKNLPVSKVGIEMIYKGEDQLITKEQVQSVLNKKYGNLTNYKRKEIFHYKIKCVSMIKKLANQITNWGKHTH